MASKKIMNESGISILGPVNNHIKDETQRQYEVVVVYDGKSSRSAACNIKEHLHEKGQTIWILDSERYRKEAHRYVGAKVIIVGHNSLATELLKRVGRLKYDCYGMKFGFSDNLCVIRASKSELGYTSVDKEMFREYYEERMALYMELADSFHAPITNEFNKSTLRSQYDLLWLEFISLGLSQFLRLRIRKI